MTALHTGQYGGDAKSLAPRPVARSTEKRDKHEPGLLVRALDVARPL